MENRKWKNKNFIQALKHAIDGIKYTFKNERNLKIQFVFAISTIVLALFLRLNFIEWAILVLTIGFVIFAELINTAFEIIMDVYSQEYNEKIKIVKDIASGAVWITSFISVIVGCSLFLPKLIKM